MSHSVSGDCCTRLRPVQYFTTSQVRDCKRVGARIFVAPDTDAEAISTAVELGLTPYPGAATPTEAFAAIKAGATQVKLFPSSAVGISGMKAWGEVLPEGTELFTVGGAGADNAAEGCNAGAAGLDLGVLAPSPRRPPR